MRRKLSEYGYPAEGVVSVCWNGCPDAENYPQEAFPTQTCGWCRVFNKDDCVCPKDGLEKDPDADSCDDIDYIDDMLEELRDPVREEYRSEENFQRAKKAIAMMRMEASMA